MSSKAARYVKTMNWLGVVASVYGLTQSGGVWGWPVVFCVAAAAILAPIKLRLPGLTGTYSPGFLAALWAISHLSLAESIVTGATVALCQSLVNAHRRPTLQQIWFNLGNLVLTVTVCFLAVSQVTNLSVSKSHPSVFVFAAAVYFVFNTGVVSGILSLLSGQPLRAVISSWYTWSLPYHLVGSAALSCISAPGEPMSWQGLIPVLALLLLVQFYSSLNGMRDRGVHAGRLEGSIPRSARAFVAIVVAAAAALTSLTFESPDVRRLLAWAIFTALASSRKVNLPGVEATLSLGFVAILVGIAELPVSEVSLVAMVSAAVQCLWFPVNKPRTDQVVFSMAALGLSAALAGCVSRLMIPPAMMFAVMAVLTVATVVFYLCNTLLVAAVISLVTGNSSQIWQKCHFWVFSYYLVGAAAAGVIVSTARSVGWGPAMLAVPALYLAFVSYGLQVRGWLKSASAQEQAAAA